MYYLKRLGWNDLSEKQRSLFICIWLPVMFHCPPTFPILGQAAFRVFQAGGLRKDSLLGRRGRQEGFADVFASVKKILVKKMEFGLLYRKKTKHFSSSTVNSFTQSDSFQTGLPNQTKNQRNNVLAHENSEQASSKKKKKNRKEVIRSSRRNWHSSRKPVQ